MEGLCLKDSNGVRSDGVSSTVLGACLENACGGIFEAAPDFQTNSGPLGLSHFSDLWSGLSVVSVNALVFGA
jgi:hypothetical protein